MTPKTKIGDDGKRKSEGANSTSKTRTRTNAARKTPDAPAPARGPSDGSVTVGAFQRLIRDRYLPTDAARGTAGTFMWFIEEVGELATALQDNAPGKSPTAAERANLEEEFADVLAWLMTLANINGVDMEGALKKYTEEGRVEGVKD
jgi:NTP pyrophosphatase (non-canonical NTP hydrolase)